MTRTFELISLNANFNNHHATLNRNQTTFISEVTQSKPTFIALQEFGQHSLSYDLDGQSIQDALIALGYAVVLPSVEARYPVNVRLFYQQSAATLLEPAPTITKDYQNRQCGGRFLIGQTEVLIYSLYLPLAFRDQGGKQRYWDDILYFAKQQVKNETAVILAGDFNESLDVQDQTAFVHKIKQLATLFAESDTASTWRDKRLDHIFVSPKLNPNVQALKTQMNTISDHQKLQLTVALAK